MDSGGGGADEASRPATAEEEALKKNTDCVYFLASPLTCKKGSECEYRHSEVARVNPRDCWYWLNGECLNPKCAFRHPPLDSLFGVSGSKSGPAHPSPAPFQAAYGPSGYNINKQNVPCYYFQKGQCLKGDKCLFMHGQSTAGSSNPPHVETNYPLSDPPPTNNKERLIVKDIPSQQSLHRENANKREMPSLSAKAVVVASASNNGSELGQRVSSYPSEYEHPPFESNSVLLSWSENVRSPSVDEYRHTGREVDEFLGESSPGFDVLVGDHVEDPDYFQNEEEYGRASVQGGRNLKLLDDFDYHHSDYEHVSRTEKENFIEKREYDRYGRSERRQERSLTPEKRKFNTDRVGDSDLRHRLKQRRLNGGRSTVSPERRPSRSKIDHRLHEQRSRAGFSSREYQSIQKEGFIGSRLHGRISLPVTSETEINSLRNQNRLSTGRPMNYQGRLHERINRQNDNLNYDSKKYNGQTTRRVGSDTMDFAGPKSLAELKCGRVSEVSQDQLLGPRDDQDSKVSLSFEGPKSLSDILKKKRNTVSGNGSCNIDGRNHRDSEKHIGLPISEAGCDGHLQHAFEATKGGNSVIDPEPQRVADVDEHEEEDMIPEENEELLNGEFSEKGELNEEDGVIVDGIDYNATDNYNRVDGESDYEGADGGELKLEDDEVYPEDEEEDADDDFAKRAGFLLS